MLSVASLSPLYPVVFYGVLAAGGVFSGASTAFTTGELGRQIRDSKARVLICSREYAQLVQRAAEQCEVTLNRILVMDASMAKNWKLLDLQGNIVLDTRNGPMLDWKRITSLPELQSTTACLLYSSGTTGLPKGVRLSHWNLVASNICSMEVSSNFLATKENAKQQFQYRTLAHLPMAHIAGIMLYSINVFYMGGTAYWMPKYDFEQFVRFAGERKVTVQFSVPPVWLQISKSREAEDGGHFASLEVAIAGAAPMGAELARDVSEKLGDRRNLFMTQTWGTTETAGSITAHDWDAKDETGSVGGILPNVKLRIVDDAGVDMPPGNIGELWVKGPQVMQGYHQNESATNESLRDGWYATGDVGRVKDGLVHIVDRKKELIKYKGLQVAPAELEDCLVSHAKIVDAAVVGVFSKKLQTEVPKAFVVRVDETLLEGEVVDFVTENLAAHKQLRGGVEFVEGIPKSPSGKILRKQLREKIRSDLKPRL